MRNPREVPELQRGAKMARASIPMPSYLKKKEGETRREFRERHITPVWDNYMSVATEQGVKALEDVRIRLKEDLERWKNYWFDLDPSPAEWRTTIQELEGIEQEIQQADTEEEQLKWEAAYGYQRNRLGSLRSAFRRKDECEERRFRIEIVENILLTLGRSDDLRANSFREKSNCTFEGGPREKEETGPNLSSRQKSTLQRRLTVVSERLEKLGENAASVQAKLNDTYDNPKHFYFQVFRSDSRLPDMKEESTAKYFREKLLRHPQNLTEVANRWPDLCKKHGVAPPEYMTD
jgi:hypothetical protein